MKTFQPQILGLVKYIALLVALSLILSRVDFFLKNRAVNDCSEMSRFEKTDRGTKIAYPLQDLYKECLKQKGL